jgi:hypothetical protein
MVSSDSRPWSSVVAVNGTFSACAPDSSMVTCETPARPTALVRSSVPAYALAPVDRTSVAELSSFDVFTGSS